VCLQEAGHAGVVLNDVLRLPVLQYLAAQLQAQHAEANAQGCNTEQALSAMGPFLDSLA